MITHPDERGALTGAFYAVAYAVMIMPVVVSSVARPVGYSPVLAALTVIGVAGSASLVSAARHASRAVAEPA
jgi:hypothetical protein